MRSTGIVRKLDELGRLVLPIELRRTLGLEDKDPVEIFLDDEKIVLKKYQPNEEKIYVLKELEEIRNTTQDPVHYEMLSRAINLIK